MAVQRTGNTADRAWERPVNVSKVPMGRLR